MPPSDFTWTCTCSRSIAVWFVNKHAKRISADFVTWPSQAESRHVSVGPRSRTKVFLHAPWTRIFGKNILPVTKKGGGGYYPTEMTFQVVFQFCCVTPDQLYLVNRAVSLGCLLWFVSLTLFWYVGCAGATDRQTEFFLLCNWGHPLGAVVTTAGRSSALSPVTRRRKQFWPYTYFWNAPISAVTQWL